GGKVRGLHRMEAGRTGARGGYRGINTRGTGPTGAAALVVLAPTIEARGGSVRPVDRWNILAGTHARPTLKGLHMGDPVKYQMWRSTQFYGPSHRCGVGKGGVVASDHHAIVRRHTKWGRRIAVKVIGSGGTGPVDAIRGLLPQVREIKLQDAAGRL